MTHYIYIANICQYSVGDQHNVASVSRVSLPIQSLG